MARSVSLEQQGIVRPATAEAQRIAELERQLAAAQQVIAQRNVLTLKITAPRTAGTNGLTDKGTPGGAVSLYGLQRFPVTLYAEQWERLAAYMPEVLAFIAANAPRITRKAS